MLKDIPLLVECSCCIEMVGKRGRKGVGYREGSSTRSVCQHYIEVIKGYCA